MVYGSGMTQTQHPASPEARLAAEAYERHVKAVDRAERAEHAARQAAARVPAEDMPWYIEATMSTDERIDAKRRLRPGLYGD